MLEVENVSKHFGGVTALDGVSFRVNAGEIFAIIGPNGAGKTTLFNVVSGLYHPSGGKVRVDGVDLLAYDRSCMTRLGLGRTFQSPQVFPSCTVMETVLIGGHIYADRRLLGALFRFGSFRDSEEKQRAEAMALLSKVGLAGDADRITDGLPYGALKRLDLARALAARPKLLLLDEPAAGLNSSETADLKQTIASIAADGTTIVLVEHDMKLVMGVSERILVLNYGKKLIEGTPAEVRTNPAVIAAYLGADTEEVA